MLSDLTKFCLVLSVGPVLNNISALCYCIYQTSVQNIYKLFGKSKCPEKNNQNGKQILIKEWLQHGQGLQAQILSAAHMTCCPNNTYTSGLTACVCF